MPSDVPIEVQLEVFRHLMARSPSTLSSVCRTSKAHNALVTPLLYRHIATRSRTSLVTLSYTLARHPSLAKHVQSFFFRGPQTRRVTGEDALTLLADEEGEEEQANDPKEEDGGVLSLSRLEVEEIKEMQRLGLEPGLEGADGQDATWDEHEAAMQLCTNILRICAPSLISVGFVDCVPWFLAPSEGGTLNFPLPRCEDFTGVTVGLFGLLPHLQRNGQRQLDEAKDEATSLRRIHLIGGDFGSFALHKALMASPTVQTLTHLHISAPSLYRAEHHAHLVAHIKAILCNASKLKRVSVGILQWHPPPPVKRSKHRVVEGTSEEKVIGRGKDDDRLLRTREAYMYALPEALQQSEREDVHVALIKLPFARASPAGFGGWIMKHHRPFIDDANCIDASQPDAYRKAWMHLWRKRDLSQLSPGLSLDGAPASSIWDIEPTMEWSFSMENGIKILKGSSHSW